MKIKLLALSTLFATTTFAIDLVPKSYDVNVAYNYSKISGFVQIPKGGQNGTTSVRRPTFSEMGIKNLSSPELEFQANWNDFSTYLKFNYIKFNGNAILKEDLISHSKRLPKGSHIETTHTYKNYTTGIKYNLYSNKYLSLHPLMEYSLYDFKYLYTATTPNNKSISSGRTFHWGQLNLGLELVTPITENYKISSTLKYAVTQKKVREYISLKLSNEYTVFKNNSQKLTLLFGVGASRLEFRDTQKDKQNHIIHKVIPNIFAGLEFEF